MSTTLDGSAIHLHSRAVTQNYPHLTHQRISRPESETCFSGCMPYEACQRRIADRYSHLLGRHPSLTSFLVNLCLSAKPPSCLKLLYSVSRFDICLPFLHLAHCFGPLPVGPFVHGALLELTKQRLTPIWPENKLLASKLSAKRFDSRNKSLRLPA